MTNELRPAGQRTFRAAAICAVAAGLSLLVPLGAVLAGSRKLVDIAVIGGCILAGPIAVFATTWRMRRRADHPIVLFVLALVASWPQFLMAMTLAAVGGGGGALAADLLLGALASITAIVLALVGAFQSRRTTGARPPAGSAG